MCRIVTKLKGLAQYLTVAWVIFFCSQITDNSCAHWVSIVGSLRDREVACSASDRQGSNFESCVWRTVSSQSSQHPQEVLLAQFSLYVHKGGLKPDSFHFFLAPIDYPMPGQCIWRRPCIGPLLGWRVVFFRIVSRLGLTGHLVHHSRTLLTASPHTQGNLNCAERKAAPQSHRHANRLTSVGIQLNIKIFPGEVINWQRAVMSMTYIAIMTDIKLNIRCVNLTARGSPLDVRIWRL